MDNIVVSREGSESFTQVSTIFIDEYMPYANDAQLKVYLYLLRSLQTSGCTGVSDMADRFNYTEKDVLRALEYWERIGLLNIFRDPSGAITHLCLQNPGDKVRRMHVVVPSRPSYPEYTTVYQDVQAYPVSVPSAINTVPVAPVQIPAQAVLGSEVSSPVAASEKQRVYSADDIKSFRNNDETGEIIFFAEKYLGKSLSATDLQSLLYIYDQLQFSTELIDHLIQYCVEKGKRSMRYIQKVALNWHESGISTVAQAKEQSGLYEKIVYDVLKSLGISNSPTMTENSIIQKWIREFGYDRIIIDEACKKSVLSANGNRLKYADKIITSWYNNNIHTLEDIRKSDSERAGSYRAASYQTPKKNGTFSCFPQQDYDIEDLERRLVTNRG